MADNSLTERSFNEVFAESRRAASVSEDHDGMESLHEVTRRLGMLLELAGINCSRDRIAISDTSYQQTQFKSKPALYFKLNLGEGWTEEAVAKALLPMMGQIGCFYQGLLAGGNPLVCAFVVPVEDFESIYRKASGQRVTAALAKILADTN